jgi:heme-degrading monooxygenase HmoA
VAQLYTSGDWLVQEGREEEFVAAWEELADWTGGNVSGAGWATLLRDRDQPRRFLSFGPWESLEAIEAWRASDGFQERVARIRELVEDLRTHTFEVAAQEEAGKRFA